MKILITNRTMSIRNGAETYVQDLAMELLAQGHRPMVYTAEVGATGRELIDLTIPVTDDLDTLGVRPDVIHGQHFMTAMTALAYFRDVPMVGVSHGWRPWTETPIRHPNVVRYVAVDEAVRDRLSLQHGIEDDRISIVHNSVDLERFQRTAAPGESLRRMLLFSNYVLKGSPYFLAAHQAAEELGVELDVVGTGTNSQTSAPEKILGDYDLVLAQGRSAIEAMAAGASVMIGSSRAFGPLVRPDNVERLRELNFGIRTQTLPVAASTITSQLAGYSAADASEVSSWIRDRVGVPDAVRQLITIYEEAIGDFDPAAVDPDEAARATGRFLTEATAQFHDVLHKYNAARPQARLDARGMKLQVRAQGERDDLREQLAKARADLRRERRTVDQLQQRVDAQQARLDGLLASRAVRAQRRVRSTPALTNAYRGLLGALGRR